jgi:RNA polymerase sigma-70 factor (ECF subfamily)
MNDTQKTIEQVLKGDRDAYSQLVYEHQDMLVAYAGFRIPDRAMVDEVVQMTFIRAYEQLEKYVSGSDFGVWLRSICKYMILRELKRCSRNLKNRKKYSEKISQRLIARAMETEPEVDNLNIIEKLKKCMNALRNNARKVVTAKYIEEKSVNQISEESGHNVSWVTTILYRSRALLRKCIGQRTQTEGI